MNPTTDAATLAAATPARPTVARPVRRARAATMGERIIELLLLLAGSAAIIITIAILVVLIGEARHFFEQVSISEFLTGTRWTPLSSDNPHFGIWPLLSATLMTALLALAVAVPLGLLAAIYLSEYASRRSRAIIKPALELLAGVPTIVYGFFALTLVTPALRDLVPGLAGFNILSAGLVIGIMIVPMVSSLAEDAIYAVPVGLREASYGLGASKLPTIFRVVVPSAWSGIAAAFTLAASRAIGETMIVAIAAGQNTNLAFDPREPGQTMTAFIVDISKGETAAGTLPYYTIFAVALTLFVVTLGLNVMSHRLSRRLRAQGRA
jgi:phosphate transport system permease protein